MDFIFPIVSLVVGIIVGFLINRFLLKKQNDAMIADLNRKADKTLKDAQLSAQRTVSGAEKEAAALREKAESHNEKIKQKKIKEAKEKFARYKSEFQDYKKTEGAELKTQQADMRSQRKELEQLQKEFDQREQTVRDREIDLEGREAELKSTKDSLSKQQKVLARKKEELDRANEQQIQALEKVAQLTEAEAKERLLEAVRAKAETDAMALVKDSQVRAKETATKDARKIIIQTIQRMSSEYTIENTVSVFNLESDDIKGQIIGREGRNIRAIEAATGAELVVDDTPGAIVISSFDPIRREVCRLSLKRLVADGRIHPARIEEIVNKTRKELQAHIIEIGEKTVIELDIHGLDPYLVKMVGRMRFRSSYGQNLLKHSIETANLCALMCAELGFSPKQAKVAKRAGLLHDIGKVVEEETELSHALVGMELCKKYGESEVICNAVGAHHDEIEMNNILSPVVQACDSISGARPGARREVLESYLKRISDLEELAMSHDGVEKAYAMQAGRELRVLVEADKVTDESADDLSFLISQKIQDDMVYPGQIRVTVIREKRSVSIAR